MPSQTFSVPGAPELSRRLITQMMQDVDLAYAEEWKFDHGIMVPLNFLTPRYDLPVIPMRLEGLDKVLHPKMRWPKRGPVRIAFGEPLRLTGEDYGALAKQVEEAVAELGRLT